MTAYAITRNSRPMQSAAPLFPMAAEQQRFWALFHSRRLAAPADGTTTPAIEAGAGSESAR